MGLRTNIAFGLALAFLVNTLGPLPWAQAQDFALPSPGVMVSLSPAFAPPVLKGIKVHPDNPFRFDFILDKGDSQLSNEAIKDESSKLIKYFLASLTVPEKDLWVNLSPYEKDRIIPSGFGLTEMGRDLLAEDYMLKQITASLIYPEGETGKKFWRRIYEEAEKKFGTTNIPVNTFNKVWIVPEKAVVYENAKAGTAYVVESKLKVMLEQDYLSLQKHEGSQSKHVQIKGTNQLGSQIVREIVIPELIKEVNESRNFVQLRQVYNSLILATWYKKKIKDSILEQVYVDKNKVAGVNIDDPQENQKIYERYLQAFKKGVYNYIKEDVDSVTNETIPRKYFSGGVNLAMMTSSPTMKGMKGIDGAMSVTNKPSVLRSILSFFIPSRLVDISAGVNVEASVGVHASNGTLEPGNTSQQFNQVQESPKTVDTVPADVKPEVKVYRDPFDRTVERNEMIQKFNAVQGVLKAVDMGTSNGDFLIDFRKKFPEAAIIGYEKHSTWTRELDNKSWQVSGDAIHTGLPSNSIDKVFINAPDPEMLDTGVVAGFLKEAKRILRPMGMVYIVYQGEGPYVYLKWKILSNLQEEGFEIEQRGVPLFKLESDYPTSHYINGFSGLGGKLIFFKAHKGNGIEEVAPSINEISREFEALSYSGRIEWASQFLEYYYQNQGNPHFVENFHDFLNWTFSDIDKLSLGTLRGLSWLLSHQEFVGIDVLGKFYDGNYEAGEEILNQKIKLTLNRQQWLNQMVKYVLRFERNHNGPAYKRAQYVDRAMVNLSKEKIRQRFEELKQKYGGKASWLLVLQELGLPDKLDFKIPPLVLFDKQYLQDLAKRYEDNEIAIKFGELDKSVEETPGPFLDTTSWNIGEQVSTYLAKKMPIPEFLEIQARSHQLNFYCSQLLYKNLTNEEFDRLLEQLFVTSFKHLLLFATKEEWKEFFHTLKDSTDIKRMREPQGSDVTFPHDAIDWPARRSIQEAIKSFIFFHSISVEEQRIWMGKIKNLPADAIWRSSAYNEDTFQTSNAGVYISLRTDKLRAIEALSDVIPESHHDTISDKEITIDHTAFLQDYIFADTSGVAFSNLGGYTTIESVIGEGKVAVEGKNNTVIDLDHNNGHIEAINYGFHREPRALTWQGVDLEAWRDGQAQEYIHWLWERITHRIPLATGIKKSPLSEQQIKYLRQVVTGLEDILGFPVDVEFAFKENQLFITQLRPITGQNATAPQPLPRFKPEDIIANVPMSIGATTSNGFQGRIVTGISLYAEPQIREQLKGGYHYVGVDVVSVLRALGLSPQNSMFASEDPVDFPHLPVLINTFFASRVYHHGIRFREQGTVVAGLPELMHNPLIAWQRKLVELQNQDGKIHSLYVNVSKEPYKLYSNGFRAVLVKVDAVPEAAGDQAMTIEEMEGIKHTSSVLKKAATKIKDEIEKQNPEPVFNEIETWLERNRDKKDTDLLHQPQEIEALIRLANALSIKFTPVIEMARRERKSLDLLWRFENGHWGTDTIQKIFYDIVDIPAKLTNDSFGSEGLLTVMLKRVGWAQEGGNEIVSQAKEMIALRSRLRFYVEMLGDILNPQLINKELDRRGWEALGRPESIYDDFLLPAYDMITSDDAQISQQSKTGGIDLTPANMHLQTQNSNGEIHFHMDPAMLKQLQNAPGFVPVIINIQPLKNLQQFLGTGATTSV